MIQCPNILGNFANLQNRSIVRLLRSMRAALTDGDPVERMDTAVRVLPRNVFSIQIAILKCVSN